MKRRWITAASLCGAMAVLWGSVLMAKPGIVKTKDGRTLEGDVTEKSDGIVITLRGIPTSIARDNVESVQYVGTVEEQYKKKLADLPKNPTVKDHLDLARWLFDNKSYTLASKEVDAALQLDANNTEANTLYTTIQSQLRMERNKVVVAPGTGATTRPPVEVKPVNPGEGPAHTAAMHKYLSPEEINAIKQAEWPNGDTTVKVSLGSDVKKKFVASAQENAAAFSALSPVEQARRIIAEGSADLRKEVKISNDPAPLAEYKKTIQPMILNSCAGAGCHGGASGGKLFLYGTPDGDAATYTNFYLLTQTSAQSDGATRTMFNRDYPTKSLLVEWGLPAEISKVSHPEVKGVTWRPMFRSLEDPQYKTFIKWMGKLVPLEPNYGFSFSLEAPEPKPEPPVKPAPQK